MNNLRTEETMPNLAHHPQPCTRGELLDLASIEVEEAQIQFLVTVACTANQGSLRAELNLVVHDIDLDLGDLTWQRIAQSYEACFILVTQRKMEHKVEVGEQPELVELFTRCLGDPGKRRIRL